MDDLDDEYELDDDELAEFEEWQPDRGECDNCLGDPPVQGPFGPVYCACGIGQGAAPGDCVCGPLRA